MAAKPNPFKRFEFGRKDKDPKSVGKEGGKKDITLDKKQAKKPAPAKKKC